MGNSALQMRETSDQDSPAVLVTTIVAGMIGAGFMYWTWRGVLHVPFELSIGLHMDPATERVRPWAPWWVPVVIMTLMTMMLWRLFVARARRMLVMGATIILFVVSNLTYAVATLCLEYGAMLQYVPQPPLTRMLAVLPYVLFEGAQMAFVYFMMATPVGWILLLVMCAIIGAMTIGVGKLVAHVSS